MSAHLYNPLETGCTTSVQPPGDRVYNIHTTPWRQGVDRLLNLLQSLSKVRENTITGCSLLLQM